MKEKLEFGSAPYNEECAQTGNKNYAQLAHIECAAFINQLTRLYCNKHKCSSLPKNFRFKIKTSNHDFGRYYEVQGIVNEANSAESKDALEALFWFDRNLPANWDNLAQTELNIKLAS